MKLMEAIEFNPKESLPKKSLAKKIGMEKLSPFYKYIDAYEYEKYSGGSKFRNGDTIVARITPCLENGKTAFVDFLDEKEIAFGSTEFIVMRAKEGITIPEYVYYLAISPWFRNKAISLMTGTSGRQRVQIDPLKLEEFSIPSLSEQKKITKILSDLDNKIKINNEINNNLSKLEKTLYNEIFKDLDSENQIKLGELCNIKYGKGLPTTKIEKNGFPVYGGNGIIGYYHEYMYEESQILISCRGAASGNVIISKPNSFVTNNSLILECDRKYHHYLKQYSLNNYYYEYTTGSAQPQITIDNIKDILINIPSDDMLEKFNKQLDKIEEKYFLNIEEINNLEQLRDTLLPKLMNGEVDLDNIEV